MKRLPTAIPKQKMTDEFLAKHVPKPYIKLDFFFDKIKIKN